MSAAKRAPAWAVHAWVAALHLASGDRLGAEGAIAELIGAVADARLLRGKRRALGGDA